MMPTVCVGFDVKCLYYTESRTNRLLSTCLLFVRRQSRRRLPLGGATGGGHVVAHVGRRQTQGVFLEAHRALPVATAKPTTHDLNKSSIYPLLLTIVFLLFFILLFYYIFNLIIFFFFFFFYYFTIFCSLRLFFRTRSTLPR